MDVDILPAVAQVALPGEETYHPTFMKDGEGFGRHIVMLVYLRQSVRKVVFLMEDRVGVGQLDPFLFGEHFLHLSHGELLEAVVVVDMEESAADKIGAEVVDVLRREDDIAVSGDMDERVVEYVGAAHIDGGILRVEVHVELRVAEPYEVCE